MAERPARAPRTACCGSRVSIRREVGILIHVDILRPGAVIVASGRWPARQHRAAQFYPAGRDLGSSFHDFPGQIGFDPHQAFRAASTLSDEPSPPPTYPFFGLAP